MRAGIAVHLSFRVYVAEVAEVSVASDGSVRVHRVVCAVDCGPVVNPAIVESQMQSAIVYGLTAALWGEIHIDKGRAVEGNFDTYRMLRMSEMPVVEVHIVPSTGRAGRGGRAGHAADRAGGGECDLRAHGQADPEAADREGGVRW